MSVAVAEIGPMKKLKNLLPLKAVLIMTHPDFNKLNPLEHPHAVTERLFTHVGKDPDLAACITDISNSANGDPAFNVNMVVMAYLRGYVHSLAKGWLANMAQ